MYRFNYITGTRDGKMTGTVSSDYIADSLVNRSIGSVATADNGSGISISLSDGGYIRFLLKPDAAEVVYDAPNRK